MLENRLLSEEYIPILFEFEQKNKSFFEKTCSPRPEGYDLYTTFFKINKKFIEQMDKKSLLMYLIFNDNELVGRINVTSFEEEDGKITALLGYRIGEDFNGNGFATQSVQKLKSTLKEDKYIEKLYAGAAIDNFGSQIVLLKNQFNFIEQVKNLNYEYGPGDIYVEFECTL